MTNAVLFERRGHVAVITLNRPDVRNAVNRQLAAELEAAVDRLETDTELRSAVLCANTTGQDRPVFCAGADLKALSDGVSSIMTDRGGFAGYVYRERSKPIVAAVDGLATAGGCEIVLASDIAVASTRSSFGLAEVRRNLIAAAGGLFRLPRAIGKSTAMEAILTGDPIPAERALTLGLVSRLAEPADVLDVALGIATRIAESAPLAVQASRRVVLAAAYMDDRTLRDMCDEELDAVMRSDDTAEGLAAFAEKRAPQWTGR